MAGSRKVGVSLPIKVQPELEMSGYRKRQWLKREYPRYRSPGKGIKEGNNKVQRVTIENDDWTCGLGKTTRLRDDGKFWHGSGDGAMRCGHVPFGLLFPVGLHDPSPWRGQDGVGTEPGGGVHSGCEG